MASDWPRHSAVALAPRVLVATQGPLKSLFGTLLNFQQEPLSKCSALDVCPESAWTKKKMVATIRCYNCSPGAFSVNFVWPSNCELGWLRRHCTIRLSQMFARRSKPKHLSACNRCDSSGDPTAFPLSADDIYQTAVQTLKKGNILNEQGRFLCLLSDAV